MSESQGPPENFTHNVGELTLLRSHIKVLWVWISLVLIWSADTSVWPFSGLSLASFWASRNKEITSLSPLRIPKQDPPANNPLCAFFSLLEPGTLWSSHQAAGVCWDRLVSSLCFLWTLILLPLKADMWPLENGSRLSPLLAGQEI